ncbi:MAG: peptide chain release factor N(5)-glutamine methyltransferase [Aquaticitalea sp.]
MVLKEIQNIFHKELDVIYGKDEVDSFFYLLTNEYLGMQRLVFILQPEFAITKDEEQPLFEALTKLKQEKPIQYILGKTEFYGLPLKLNEHTLIPRPETEELVDFVVQSLKFKIQGLHSYNILDVGTGSGCIAISLAKNLPNAKIFALDVSVEALKVARENAKLNDVNVHFIQADILKEKDWYLELGILKFDLMVSNPPYVRNLEKAEMKNNVLNNEPALALFVDDDNPLVFYKAIIEFANKYLKNGGELYFEINQYLGDEMIMLLENFGFNEIELKKDMFGNDRMVKGIKNFD